MTHPSGGMPPARPLRDVNAALREHLGRRLVVALLTATGALDDEGARALASMLRSYDEIRLIELHAPDDDQEQVRAMLEHAGREDADAVLVWIGADAPPSERWQRTVIAEAEDLGLWDRSFMALVGTGASRTGARALGYEDGFGSDVPCTGLATALASEAITRAEAGTRGSSPPCYL